MHFAILKFHFPKIASDKAGRWAIAQLDIENNKFTICGVYGSNFDDPSIFDKINVELLGWQGELIVLGDFNCIMRYDLDTTRRSAHQRMRKTRAAIQEMGSIHAIRDAWRVLFPELEGYTYYSASHKLCSRIDMVWASEVVLATSKMEIYPRVTSDHNPLLLSFTIPNKKGPRPFSFPRYLLSDFGYVNQLKTHIKEFLDINVGTASPTIVWDTCKASIRGFTQQFIWHQNVQRRKATEKTITDILELEKKLAESLLQGSSDLQDLNLRLIDLKSALKATFRTRIISKLKKYRLLQYESGEKIGKALAYKVAEDKSATYIKEIKGINNEIYVRSSQILEQFAKYYSQLYTPEAQSNLVEILHYLHSNPPPKLETEGSEDLTSDISHAEIRLALTALPSGKASGEDTIPLELYKTCIEELLPIFNLVIRYIGEGHQAPGSWNTTKIIFFLKKGKPADECGSYRPISLINNDAKIFAKILATRLAPKMPNLVSPQQHGFIMNRDTTVHANTAITAFDAARLGPTPLGMILLDAEKAFDRVGWDFLWATLSAVGINGQFLLWVRALYDHPVAKISYQGMQSSPFPILRGTRQGCPLSPLLFALSIEPYLIALQNQAEIIPYTIGTQSLKITVFADDIAIYSTDVLAALDAVTLEANRFGRVSGYKLNPNKTQILTNYTILDPPVGLCDVVTYLDIKISSDTTNGITLNYEALLKDTALLLKKWHKIPIGIIGRINLIKMKVLPRFIYLFRSIPLRVNNSFFNRLEGILGSFIWGYKKTRRALALLKLPFNQGGLDFPDFKQYFWAAFVGRFRSLLYPSNTYYFHKFILGTESNMFLFRINDPNYFKRVKFKTLRDCVTIWRNMLGKCKAGFYYTKFPLWDNPGLPDIFHDGASKTWPELGIKTLGDLYDTSGLMTFETLITLYKLKEPMRLKYYQIRDYFKHHVNKVIKLESDIWEFIQDTTKKKCISKGYKCINSYKVGDSSKLATKWSQKMGYTITPQTICSALCSINKIVYSSSLKLQQHKTICMLYYTPEVIAKWATSNPASDRNKCPKCDLVAANLEHMFVTCPGLKLFWQGVNQVLTQRLTRPISLVAIDILMGGQSTQTIQGSLISILIACARLTIARAWISPNPPTVFEWWGIVTEIYEMESMLAKARGIGPSRKFEKIWGCFM